MAEDMTGFAQPPPGKGPPPGLIVDQNLEDTEDILETKPSLAPQLPPVFQKSGMDNSVPGENRAPPPWSTVANPPWSTATRPLSDIRELTEPSLAELTSRNHERPRRPSFSRQASTSRKGSISRKPSINRKNSLQESIKHNRQESSHVTELDINQTLPQGEQTDASSAYSLPLDNVPPRTSSRAGRRPQRVPSIAHGRQPSFPAPPPRGLGYTIPNRGKSRSPVKNTYEEEGHMRRLPSRTFLRTAEPNLDVLDFPKHQHPRVSIELHAAARLFVGGGSVEGHVRVVIDDLERIRHRRQLAMSRISIDLIGVEEMSISRRNVFLNLATELMDSENPPPHSMVESLKQISPIDPFWVLAPSVSHLPFLISLPLDVGPPPFHSKIARVRYVLCATALVRDQGKQYLVRSSQEVCVLSVYDPEKALVSLPSPLTASDEYVRHRDHGVETIKVTAGLHRQVWVSGTSIFVDVAVHNRSKKTIKRIELQLERDILCYKHVAATTREKSASQARIFDSNDRTILSKSIMKQGIGGWTGISAHTSDTRTCDLELPRGHATVKCGKFFEVRYFLNIVVNVSHSKNITVQLPIVLIHMNSLDVVPNSVAQVAAAIEEKRAKIQHRRNQSKRSVGPRGTETITNTVVNSGSPTRLTRQLSNAAANNANVQGRAFAAPRKQSLDRMRQEAEDLNELGRLLEDSPRKYIYSPRRQHRATAAQHHQPTPSGSDAYKYHTPPSNRKGRVLSDDMGDEVMNIRARLRRMRSTDTERTNATNRSHNHRHHQRRPTDESSAAGFGVRRKLSSQSGKSSRVGFRELEVAEREDEPVYGTPHVAQQRPSRFEGLSAASARRKMRSTERWKGAGWFGGGDRRGESREREREEKQRMMANWI